MGKARWGRPRRRRGGVLVLRRSAVADTPRRRSLHEQSACGRRALSDLYWWCRSDASGSITLQKSP